jgi:hypothetical protein
VVGGQVILLYEANNMGGEGGEEDSLQILPFYQPHYLGVRVGQRRTGAMLSIQSVQ